jgi:hypothetical protein
VSGIYFILWGFILLIPQASLRLPFFGYDIGIHASYILIIYAGFMLPFWEGLIGCILVSILMSTLSQIPQSFMIISNAILFISIKTIVDRLYTEAYLTKALWVFPFSIFYQFLHALTLNPDWAFWGEARLWSHFIFQGAFDVIVALPLFIVLDLTYELWSRLFSSKRANLTGADMYQVKNPQRKYI